MDFVALAKWLIPSLPVAAGAAYGAWTFHRNGIRDRQKKMDEANELLNAVEQSLAHKARRAFRGRPGTGISEEESWDLEEKINRALRLAPRSAKTFQTAGNYYKAVGRLRDAEKAYRKAIKLDPNDPMSHCLLFIQLSAQTDNEAAVKCLQTARKLARNSPSALLSIGMTLSTLEKLDEAELVYREAIQTDPSFSALWYNLGSVLRKQGRHRESYDALQRAAAINPNDPEIFCNLGNASIRLGNIKEALDHLLNSVRLKPDYALPHRSLAVVYESLGDRAKAAEEEAEFERLSQ